MTPKIDFELVNPKHSAILVIDPQYDLCSEYLPNGEKTPLAKMSDAAGISPPAYDYSLYPGVLSKLQPLLKAARAVNVLVVYTQATRLIEARTLWRQGYLAKIYRVDPTKVTIPIFSVPGTPGWEFVKEVKPHPGDVVIQKSRQSAFIGTPLELLLKNQNIKTLVFTGCQTDCCVESTLRDASLGFDYFCVLVEDCIASFNVEMHEAQMKIMKSHFDTVHSKTLIELWNS